MGLSSEQKSSRNVLEPGNHLAVTPRFRSLLRQLIEKKEKLTEDQALELVRKKKEKVGGGYLTDQGALFLVAADLGITLSGDQSLRLSDLEPGQRGITVAARILASSPPRKFVRKSDSKEGAYSKLLLFDETGVCQATLWNKAIAKVLLGEKVQPGVAVKFPDVYCSSSLDGSLIINVSENSEFAVLDEKSSDACALPDISSMVISSSSEPPEEGKRLVAKGRIGDAPPSQRQFARKDGSAGNLLSFSLQDSEDPSRSIRVVIWDNENPVFTTMKNGEFVTIANLRARRTGFSGNSTLELHGDDSTCILEKWSETQRWYKNTIADLRLGGLNVTDPPNRKQSNALPFVGRVLSADSEKMRNKEKPPQIHLLIIDSRRRMISGVATGVARDEFLEENFSPDNVGIFKPDSFDEIGLKATFSSQNSFRKVNPKREDIPKTDTFVKKISDLEVGAVCTVEAMALSDSIVRDISTKEGPVRRGELLVADPTGEIKVYAWRNLSSLLEGIGAGTKVWLKFVDVQSFEGRKFLLARNYSNLVMGSEKA